MGKLLRSDAPILPSSLLLGLQTQANGARGGTRTLTQGQEAREARHASRAHRLFKLIWPADNNNDAAHRAT